MLRITPTPPAYYGKWEVDISLLARHCFATFGESLDLKDFLACFAWDEASYVDAFEKTYIWQEEVEGRVAMDARIKAMARRWHLIVLLMRAKGILTRWFLLAAASALDAWSYWARRHVFAKKIRIEAQKKRVLDLKRWVIKTFKVLCEAMAKDRLDREEDARLRAPVREFLRCHPFIKTADQAFLAGVTSPAKVYTVGRFDAPVGFLHTDVGGSLAKFVKLYPLKPGAAANWNRHGFEEGGNGSGTDDVRGGRSAAGSPSVAGSESGSEASGHRVVVARKHAWAGLKDEDDRPRDGGMAALVPTPPYAPGGFGERGNTGEFRQKWRAGEGRVVQLHLGHRGHPVPGPYEEAKRVHIPADRDAFLDVTPSVIHFEDFLHLGVAQPRRLVTVTNVGGTLRRMRVMPAQSPFFTVTSTLVKNKGRLAPGMSATITVVFTPQEKRTYYDCCVIEVEGDPGPQWGTGLTATARLQLPMHANPGPKLVASDIPPSTGFNAVASNLKPVQQMYRVEQLALSRECIAPRELLHIVASIFVGISASASVSVSTSVLAPASARVL